MYKGVAHVNYVTCIQSQPGNKIQEIKENLFCSSFCFINALQKKTSNHLNTFNATGDISHIPNADSVAPDQPAHLHSLT